MNCERSDEFWNPIVPELLVRDYEKSKRFYTDMLGFSVRHERSDPAFAYLERGHVHVMIEALESDSWLTGKMEYPLGRGVNFQVEVLDIDILLENLRLHGYPLFEDVAENWYRAGSVVFGQREFLVQDPDGYLLRFCQRLGEKSA